MSYAHIHIVLNHFPSVGTVIGLGLFLASLVRRSDELKRAGLAVLVVMALLAMPTFVTGGAAQLEISERPDLPEAMIAAHQDSAVLATIFLTATGAFAWLGLWQFRRFSRPATWTTTLVILLSVVTVAVMVRTGALGGEISHPEIRADGAGDAAPAIAGLAESIKSFVVDLPWVWPAIETLHFIGMALLFGVALVINLRMLGMMKSVPFAALHRLLPLGVMAFGFNFVSGMMFFIANAGQYVLVPSFFLKIYCIVLAGMDLLYFTVCDDVWAVGRGADAPLRAKVLAVSAVGLLLAALILGRMLPYLEVI